MSSPRTQALVLVPTRELALQTSSVLKKLGKHLAGLTVIVSTGGTDLKEDIIRLMKPCHIIVATPGRILDLANKSVADLSSCGMFVMDEADKLLSPEFVPLIDKLLSFTPDTRQILCFSATFPRTVVSFRDRWCPDAHEINLMEELTLKGVTQFYAFVDERQKVHCFPASDTRVLTNHGFLFLHEIEALLRSGVDMLYGCYEVTKVVAAGLPGARSEVEVESKELKYCKGQLVFPPTPPTHLVEFSSPDEESRWTEASGPCGADDMSDDNERSRHISLRVTPDHDMFVQTGSGMGWDNTMGVKDPYCKMPAQSLLSSNTHTHVRMLACAENGHHPQDTSRRDGVQAVLALTDSGFLAFLELLGFWLGAGCVSYNSSGDGCVRFEHVKKTGLEWLREMFSQVGLQPSSWTVCQSGDTERVSIREPAWLAWFDAEFGGQYSDSHYYGAAMEGAQTNFLTSGLARSSPLSVSSTDYPATSQASGFSIDLTTCISSTSFTFPSRSRSISAASTDSITDAIAADDYGVIELTIEDDKMQPPATDLPEPETTASVKWLPEWMLAELSRDEMRSLIAGLHRATRSCTGTAKGIHTSSARFRDQLMHALLHCGYSPHCDATYTADTTLSYKLHTAANAHDTCSVASCNDLSAAEQLASRLARATVDAWKVSWADVAHEEGRASCWPSMPRQGCITRVPYNAERDGRIWCVRVDHPDHLIVAQRAERDRTTGEVTKQSRPIIVGQCLNTLFAKLDINQVRAAPDSRTSQCWAAALSCRSSRLDRPSLTPSSVLSLRCCCLQCIIFCNSVTRVELLAKKITELGSSCLRESDSRVLTDAGFLFLSEIEECAACGEDVKYACYEAATQRIVYSTGRLVYSKPPARWVDFTQRRTRHHWPGTSELYGASQTDSGDEGSEENHLTLYTTPEHDMYVQPCDQAGNDCSTGSPLIPPHKIKAGELTPGYQCHCEAEGDVCSHGYSHYRMFTAAANGVQSPTNSVSHSAIDSPFAALHVSSEDELDAAIELMGYWLSAGSLLYEQSECTALMFALSDDWDSQYVRQLLERLLLEELTDWSEEDTGEQLTLRLTTPRYRRYFAAEYGNVYRTAAHNSSVVRMQQPPSVTRRLSLSLSSLSASLDSSSLSESGVKRSVSLLPVGTESADLRSKEEDEVQHGERCNGSKDRGNDCFVDGQESKWLPTWWHRLSAHQIRLLIAGVQQAAGCPPAATDRSRIISTSSPTFCEQLLHACLLAGYSAYFTTHTTADGVDSHRGGGVSRAKDEAVRTYRVCYSEATSEVLAAEDIRFDGKACQVSMRTASKQVDLVPTHSSSGSTSTQPFQPSVAPELSESYEATRDGRVWCVQVDHPDHLIFAQRAHRDSGGVVERAGRAIVVGNCFYIHAQMRQEHRNRVFHDFRSGSCRNLVSSDLFTRGIDIQSVVRRTTH